MIKAIYNAIGTLTNVLSEKDNILTVDSTLHSIISAALGVGDWAYLAVDDGNNAEIVKIYRSNSVGEYVVRAQDNTLACRFNVGATIRYELTAQEILDSFPISPLLVYPYGAMRVDGSIVGYRMPDIQDVGGTYSLVSGNRVILDKNIALEGCCELDNQGAPPLPSPYIYFTSHVYPLEADEAIGVTASCLAGKIQSSVLSRESLEVIASCLAGSLILALVDQVQPCDDATEVTASFLSGVLLVALVEQFQPCDDAAEVSASLVEGELRLIDIEFTQPCDDALQVTGTLLSGILE